MRAVWGFSVGSMLAVSGASAVEGSYQGSGSDPGDYKWQLHAKITPVAGRSYKVQLTSTNATCASQTEGTGTLRGNTLKTAGTCPLTIRFNGRTARVIEGEGCASEHGAACSFNGILHKGR